MRIFDIHVHIYPHKIAQKAADSIGAFYEGIPMHGNGSVEDYVRLMDEAGIERFAAHSVALNPHNVDRINSFIMKAYAQMPDRIIPFAAIHPDVEDLPGLVNRAVDMGFRGFKIHPDMQKFALDEDRARPMMEAVAGRLPILIHCGDYRYDYDGPNRLLHLHEMLPELKIIAAHFGGWGEWDRAVELLPGHEGIVVDTSSSLYKFPKEDAVALIRKLGAENVLFGSDYPMWTPKDELGRFMQLDLTDSEREDILWNNAARMFQL